MAQATVAEMTNPSFLMKRINETAIEDRPVPDESALDTPSSRSRTNIDTVFDDEIIVTVQKTGICGSDIHFLVEGRIAHLVVEAPMVLGHESSGIVTKGNA
jgi:D-xylulose reductase